VKQTAEMQRVQALMAPGVLTKDGFLGSDPRNLVDILDEDGAEVRRLGATHQGIALRMAALREAGMRGLGTLVRLGPGLEPGQAEPRFAVRVESARGGLPCPFGHPGMVRKMNTTVTNLRLGREITYTDLTVHLVGEHGFYEGRGSKFRIEPREVVEILEVPNPPGTEG
jgi:hypothetical protein